MAQIIGKNYLQDYFYRNIREEREYKKFIDENTRKVLVEKYKKPEIIECTTIRYSMDVLVNSDFIIDIKTTPFNNKLTTPWTE